MPNIIDYAETEMRSLANKPFSSVDSLVLSQFSYINFDGIVPDYNRKSNPLRLSDLLKRENFEVMLKGVRDADKNKRLLLALGTNPRFRDFEIRYFVNEIDRTEEKQFCAMTFLLSDHTAYIAFRGTDATIVGWKEDFNMAFKSPISSQERAYKYLDSVSRYLPRSIMLGGHSKGGNLAVYAALSAGRRIQNKLLVAFDHDGPGFRKGILDSDGYERIKDKILRTIPEFSLIGMLLENDAACSVIKSNRMGIMQHDPFSWIVEGGNFRIADEVAKTSRYISHTLQDWLETVSDEKRELFVNTLFNVLNSSGAESFNDIGSDIKRALPSMLSSIKGIDPEVRKFVLELLKELASLYMKKRPEAKKLAKD